MVVHRKSQVAVPRCLKRIRRGAVNSGLKRVNSGSEGVYSGVRGSVFRVRKGAFRVRGSVFRVRGGALSGEGEMDNFLNVVLHCLLSSSLVVKY